MRVLKPNWNRWPEKLDVYTNAGLIGKIDAPALIIHVRALSIDRMSPQALHRTPTAVDSICSMIATSLACLPPTALPAHATWALICSSPVRFPRTRTNTMLQAGR